ncbi:MAG: LPS export ABC transporter protein LptC [Candidatus Azotimanducaceae bacterium]|jgi:LPS export ABC transporter protein LptC
MRTKTDKLLAIAVLFGMAILFSCRNDMKEVMSIKSDENQPVEVAEGVELLYSDSAMIKLKLRAKKVLRYAPKVGKTVFPEGIHIEFLTGKGEVDTDIRADHAVKYEKDLKTEATGNVIVVNRKGERLNTEKLIWDERKELILTDEFVKVTTATQVIMGEGLVADQQFNWYEIKKIKGTIALDDE